MAWANPRLTLALPGQVDAGRTSTFSYGAKAVPQHSRIVLQRQEGTAHAWRTMIALKHHTGTGTLKALKMGAYKLRLAVLRQGRVLASRHGTLRVFGQVPLATLFASDDSGSHTSGVYTGPSRTFEYVEAYVDYIPNDVVTTVTKNPCRSIHLDFVLTSRGYVTNNFSLGTLALIQATRDPVSRTVPHDVFGALDAGLVIGQSWTIRASTQISPQSTGSVQRPIFVNGMASCYRPDLNITG